MATAISTSFWFLVFVFFSFLFFLTELSSRDDGQKEEEEKNQKKRGNRKKNSRPDPSGRCVVFVVFFWFLLNIFLFAVLRDFGVAQRWPDASSYCQRGEIERERERERERGKQDLMG